MHIFIASFFPGFVIVGLPLIFLLGMTAVEFGFRDEHESRVEIIVRIGWDLCVLAIGIMPTVLIEHSDQSSLEPLGVGFGLIGVIIGLGLYTAGCKKRVKRALERLRLLPASHPEISVYKSRAIRGTILSVLLGLISVVAPMYWTTKYVRQVGTLHGSSHLPLLQGGILLCCHAVWSEYAMIMPKLMQEERLILARPDMRR